MDWYATIRANKSDCKKRKDNSRSVLSKRRKTKFLPAAGYPCFLCPRTWFRHSRTIVKQLLLRSILPRKTVIHLFLNIIDNTDSKSIKVQNSTEQENQRSLWLRREYTRSLSYKAIYWNSRFPTIFNQSKIR